MSLHKSYRKDKDTAYLRLSDVMEVECSHFDPRQPEYVNVVQKLTRPIRKIVDQGLLKPSEDRKYAIRAFVECCMKSWRTRIVSETAAADDPIQYRPEIDISEDENAPSWLPYNVENAVMVFTKYPQFYSDVTELARDISNYQLNELQRKN